MERVLAEFRQTPGVESASLANSMPLYIDQSSTCPCEKVRTPTRSYRRSVKPRMSQVKRHLKSRRIVGWSRNNKWPRARLFGSIGMLPVLLHIPFRDRQVWPWTRKRRGEIGI